MNTSVIRFKPLANTKYEFLNQFLKSDIFKKQIDILITGGAQPNFGPAHLNQVNIPFPPIEEQQKIAEILSTVDEKIDVIDAQITQTQELKKGLMQRLLTKGIGHTQFKDSPLGEIPESWRISHLIELSINGISNGTFNDPKKTGKGYKLINVVNMYSGSSIKTNKLSLLNISKVEFEKNKVEFGDLFFTRSSLVAEGIAHCNINLSTDDDITYDGHLMRVRPNLELVLPQFLNYYCKSSRARSFFISRGKTATMTTIGQKDIANLPVLLPSLAEQQKIVNILNVVEEKIEILQFKKDHSQDLKKALMQQLLTGRLRVNQLIKNPIPA